MHATARADGAGTRRTKADTARRAAGGKNGRAGAFTVQRDVGATCHTTDKAVTPRRSLPRAWRCDSSWPSAPASDGFRSTVPSAAIALARGGPARRNVDPRRTGVHASPARAGATTIGREQLSPHRPEQHSARTGVALTGSVRVARATRRADLFPDRSEQRGFAVGAVDTEAGQRRGHEITRQHCRSRGWVRMGRVAFRAVERGPLPDSVVAVIPAPGQLAVEHLATVRSASPSSPARLRMGQPPRPGRDTSGAELPWHGRAAALRIRASRAACEVPRCARRVRCGRLPGTSRRGRNPRTRGARRAADTIERAGLARDGDAGVRLARPSGMAVGADTLRRSSRACRRADRRSAAARAWRRPPDAVQGPAVRRDARRLGVSRRTRAAIRRRAGHRRRVAERARGRRRPLAGPG